MKLIKSILALAAAVFIGTSAQAAEDTENITLMASETVEITTGEAVALKWYVTKDDTATERLDIKVERLVDSTAKVTITANGTAAGDKVAVLGLYGDGELVKTINVTITEKEDKDYLAENTGVYENAVVNYKDARLVQIGKTWEYTTVTTGTDWSIVPNASSYKGYELTKMHDYFSESIVRNEDGTAKVTITGIAPAGTKSLILDIKNSQNTVMTVQVIVVEAVEDITMLKGSTERMTGSYNGSGASRRWVADRNFNNASDQGTVGLSLKNGTREFQQADFQYASTYQDYKYQTTQWASSFNADLTANKIGSDVVRIARFEPGKIGSFSPCFLYNIYVYEEKTTNITMKSGETFDLVCESEVAGAWEVEGLAENDETVTLSAYAGWTDTSFETAITAKKVTEKTKIFKVKNNFCIYTVNLTVEQGTLIKDVSVAKGGEYNDTIEGPGTPSTDDERVATIGLSDNTVTITGVAVGDAVCTIVPGYQYKVTVYSTETNDALVGLGKTANIDCVADIAGEWTASFAEGADRSVAQIVNDWGASSTEFALKLKGLKKGSTVVLVKNAYAQYTINVEVSEQIENIELSMEVGTSVNTNLTWESAAFWTAERKTGEGVATVTVDSGETAATDAKVEAKKAGNAQWTVYVGATAGAKDIAAYTMNIKVWKAEDSMAVDLLPKETKTLNLTSAAAASWTAFSSDEAVATVTGSGVISTEFAPVITAGDVDEGSATITVQNDYVKYEISVTVKDGFFVCYYDDNENVHTDPAKIRTYETDLHIWDGDREGLELVGYTKENGEELEKSDEALRAYIKEEAEKPGCDGEVKVFGTWKKAAVTISIVVDEDEGNIEAVSYDDDNYANKDLELPAETEAVTLTLEAETSLNVPVYKVITNGVDGVVTSVTTKVATYAIKDGDKLEFFAEEADDSDATDEQIKAALLDWVDDDDAVKKVNAIVDTSATPAQDKISARELAAWINNNGILSSDFGASGYVVASAKLNARMPITDENTTNEFVNASVTANGFVFDISIVIDGRDPLDLDEKMTNIVAACIQTTENLGTGFSEEKTVDVGRVEILGETKVLIKPANPPKTAEFFQFVIPPDPKAQTEIHVSGGGGTPQAEGTSNGFRPPDIEGDMQKHDQETGYEKQRQEAQQYPYEG